MINVPYNYESIKSGPHVIQWELLARNGYNYFNFNNDKILSGSLDLALFDKFSIGNVVGRVLNLTIDTEQDLSYLELEFRLYKNESEYTEWLPKGRYFVSTQEVSEGISKLVCYDAIEKTNAIYQRTNQSSETYTDTLVSNIANKIGVNIDPDTWAYLVQNRTVFTNFYAFDAEATMRDYLSYIAGSLAGTFYIDDYGRLKLWQYGAGYNQTNYLVTDDGDRVTFGGDRIVL